MRFILIVVFALMCCSVFAGDIVTAPTANQLKRGQVDIGYYWIELDAASSAAPQHVQAQTLYVGVTDELEIDLHRYDLDKFKSDIIVNATYLLLKESSKMPNLVVGGRNIFGSNVCGIPDSDDRSWFVAAAKTVNMPKSGPPKFPIVRLHAAIGTQDPSLLGEKRHNGLFGGVQSLLTPELGLIALYDAQDLITGIAYTPKDYGFTIKGGTYGDHWWIGLSWLKM